MLWIKIFYAMIFIWWWKFFPISSFSCSFFAFYFWALSRPCALSSSSLISSWCACVIKTYELLLLLLISQRIWLRCEIMWIDIIVLMLVRWPLAMYQLMFHMMTMMVMIVGGRSCVRNQRLKNFDTLSHTHISFRLKFNEKIRTKRKVTDIGKCDRSCILVCLWRRSAIMRIILVFSLCINMRCTATYSR